MPSPNDVRMEEIPLEDDEQDSIEYKILMAYAQRRLSVSKYEKLLKNEGNVQKLPLIVLQGPRKTDHQRSTDGPNRRIVPQGGTMQQQSKKQLKVKYLPGYCLPLVCSTAKEEQPPPLLAPGDCMAQFLVAENQSDSLREESDTADVSHIADKLAKLVTSKSKKSPSDVSFKILSEASSREQDDSDSTHGSEGEEHDEEKIIQTIVSLLRQEGDQLEEKIKEDRVFYQHFRDMLSYPFFKRITDLFLEDVSADSTSEPGGQVQCTKVAFSMEVATRLTAVDNHPMNLVLGFGLKYLRDHFKPWIQEQGGWEKALASLYQEEVE
ncbi:PREDICTED: apoptosis facilitator Bcl-2-like protein 14 [Tauraco erythrolophus]|uniref:apoptosis facilitator Bcl-2-like protein 14 n=1 Tax=Tauraco erythrolophus TaxID=121530 RepID=UPI000523D7FF|nr:PREDICTED: apoptosis facilitator Bcl-2-like protein 14 [Tauraco erythrolophus]